MLPFRSFIIENKITAADWENFITVAFNGGPSKDKNTPIKSIVAYNEAKSALSRIVRALKAKKFTGRMVQTGSSVGELNPSWRGSDRTPKADMVIGKKGISLKKKGGSQLMSAKKEETISTFHAAIEMMDENSQEQAQNLAKSLSSLMTEFAVPKEKGTIGDFTKKVKSGAKFSGAQKKLADEYMNKTTMFKSMTSRVKKFFESNDEFRNYFVYEAATGAYKFKPDRSAVADYIVAFDESGETSIYTINRGYGKMGSYIPELASSVNLRISWKTHSSKSQKTFPSFRADVREEFACEETFESLWDETFGSEVNESNIIKDLVAKAKSFVKKITDKLMSLATSGISAILRFLGIEPMSVSMSAATIH